MRGKTDGKKTLNVIPTRRKIEGTDLPFQKMAEKNDVAAYEGDDANMAGAYQLKSRNWLAVRPHATETVCHSKWLGELYMLLYWCT